jgi:hypothetical protein
MNEFHFGKYFPFRIILFLLQYLVGFKVPFGQYLLNFHVEIFELFLRPTVEYVLKFRVNVEDIPILVAPGKFPVFHLIVVICNEALLLPVAYPFEEADELEAVGFARHNFDFVLAVDGAIVEIHNVHIGVALLYLEIRAIQELFDLCIMQLGIHIVNNAVYVLV